MTYMKYCKSDSLANILQSDAQVLQSQEQQRPQEKHLPTFPILRTTVTTLIFMHCSRTQNKTAHQMQHFICLCKHTSCCFSKQKNTVKNRFSIPNVRRIDGKMGCNSKK